MDEGWSILLSQARATRAKLPFPLRAYSEFMPPPYVGVKPYGEADPFTVPEGDDHGWNISEYEWAQELRPGIERIATHVLEQVVKLARGQASQVSARLVADNPAWPPALANRVGWAAEETFPLILPIALTKTQDDKGRVRWTLLGSSGALLPSEPFWGCFRGRRGNERPDAAKRLEELLSWLLRGDPAGVRFLPHDGTDLPAFVASRAYRDDEPLDGVATLVTFVAFADLPARVQWAYLEGRLRIVPFPASMVFREHPGYRKLGASEVPLLHLFPRSGVHDAIRIPQSGWLDEIPEEGERHRRAHRVHRTHRWQRVGRHEDDAPHGAVDDPVTIALFSTNADDVSLYGKPMARNCHIWTEEYELVLEGPYAGRDEIERAAAACRAGGRFGYRMYYPPMRIGDSTSFLYLPVVARWEEGYGARVWPGPLPGILLAGGEAGEVELRPRVLQRTPQRDSIELFEREPADRRQTGNCRRLLEWRELLKRPLTPSLARALLHASKEEDLEEWLAKLPSRSSDPARAEGLVTALRGLLGPEEDLGAPITLEATRTREFEERYWRTVASLAEGTFRDKNNADAVSLNAGRTGGTAAAPPREAARARDLERLREHLHAHYADLFARHGMAGRAACADHLFRWETDFDFPWMGGWARNATGEPCEANVVVVIPGRNRREAVLMADHYDTAYMEDLYDTSRGGDRLRAAAAGADDNHSATAALMLAAHVLLPLSREGKLARDVWLVHLTGEEFPADCLGARALASALLERRLVLEGGIDLSATRVKGAYVLDMVAHNREKDRDVFQIAPGEGRGSARLARIASRANQRWNRAAREWNREDVRRGRGRSKRMPDGSVPPPIAEHPLLHGEVRPEWDPRSALYNTDGQIFSDLGIPVVLFMEDYDISRSGYHDTQDTMANIDLDYGAALVAIAIESVAEAALTLPEGRP